MTNDPMKFREHFLNPKLSTFRTFRAKPWPKLEFLYPRVALAEYSYFKPCLTGRRPPDLHRSLREVGASLSTPSLIFSHSTGFSSPPSRKSPHFLPQTDFLSFIYLFYLSNLILKFGDMAHIAPCVNYSFGFVSALE